MPVSQPQQQGSGVPIPLAIGTDNRLIAQQPPTVLRNFYIERDLSGGASEDIMRIQRPGLVTYQTLPSSGGVRAIGYAQGILGSKAIGVQFDKLYSFDNTAVTNIGTVINDGLSAQLAFTNFGVAVLSSGNLYFYDTTLHAVAIPGVKTPIAIDTIDSYVIILCSDGTWFWLVPGDLTIDPLHFATAESMPDGGIAVRQLHDEVYFFGSSSIEIWGLTGQADLIMEPAPGRRIDHGAMTRDSIQALDNTLFFVADNGQVMRLALGEPKRVSHTGIEERIRKRSGAVSAEAFEFDGHSFYVLNVPGQGSYSYDVLTDNWSEFLSPQLSTGWLPACSVPKGDKFLFGDSQSGRVYTLDDTISTDNGTVFERAVSGIVAFDDGRQRNDSIQVWAGASAAATLRLRFHDANTATYGAYQTATIRTAADIVRFLRLGAAIPPYRVIELSTVDTAVVRISQAEANTGRAW